MPFIKKQGPMQKTTAAMPARAINNFMQSRSALVLSDLEFSNRNSSTSPVQWTIAHPFW